MRNFDRLAQEREQYMTLACLFTVNPEPQSLQSRVSLSTPLARRHADLHLFEQNLCGLLEVKAFPHWSHTPALNGFCAAARMAC